MIYSSLYRIILIRTASTLGVIVGVKSPWKEAQLANPYRISCLLAKSFVVYMRIGDFHSRQQTKLLHYPPQISLDDTDFDPFAKSKLTESTGFSLQFEAACQSHIETFGRNSGNWHWMSVFSVSVPCSNSDSSNPPPGSVTHAAHTEKLRICSRLASLTVPIHRVCL